MALFFATADLHFGSRGCHEVRAVPYTAALATWIASHAQPEWLGQIAPAVPARASGLPIAKPRLG
jgi:hypothetical protein